MGRRTYEVGTVMGLTNPYPHLRQFVVSSTMTASPDAAVEHVRNDPVSLVRRLKEGPGLGIWLCGGASLAGALYHEIDQLIIKVNPVVLGGGIPMFHGASGVIRLDLVEHLAFDGGVAIQSYRVVRKTQPRRKNIVAARARTSVYRALRSYFTRPLTPDWGLIMQSEIRILVVLLVIVTLWQKSAFAQQSQASCPEIKYSERITDAYLYQLDRIEGQAVYGAVSEKGEFMSASGVCVALFNRSIKRLIASVTTDNRGQFQFASAAPGRYMLIAFLSALHEIIVPVQVVDITARKAVKRWRLLLHMRSKEDWRTSFVTPVTDPVLRQELIRRVEQDQAIRGEMIKKGADHIDKATDARMAIIDSDNTARMKEIVKRSGWPGPELVGRDGTDAAFLLVQHSPDLAFQKRMLTLVRSAYVAGKLSAWNYALLVDRVLVREGKPQVYGMSVNHWNGKEPVLDPIEDEANVDKRRAKIGLPPLREYLETVKRMYFPERKDQK